jgi:hypothetical protein
MFTILLSSLCWFPDAHILPLNFRESLDFSKATAAHILPLNFRESLDFSKATAAHILPLNFRESLDFSKATAAHILPLNLRESLDFSKATAASDIRSVGYLTLEDRSRSVIKKLPNFNANAANGWNYVKLIFRCLYRPMSPAKKSHGHRPSSPCPINASRSTNYTDSHVSIIPHHHWTALCDTDSCTARQ